MIHAIREHYCDNMPRRLMISGDTELFNSVNTRQMEYAVVELCSCWQIGQYDIPQHAKYALLTDSLPVEVFLTDDGYCAVYDPLAELDYGDSQEDAIKNLWMKLEEYYDSLLERKGRLSPALQSELEHIEKFMGKKHGDR